MPTATILVDQDAEPLVLEYQFAYTILRGDRDTGYHLAQKYTVPGYDKIGYAICPAEENKPARLWITGTKICFEGTITGKPETSLQEWKAGLLQTIYKCERNAHYQRAVDQRAVDRKIRLSMVWGPLMDGRCAPFYGTPEKLQNGKFRVAENDAPNFEMPLKFGPENLPLDKTSGEDCFCTFLVLVRVRDKSIIELSRISWTVSWGGTYSEVAESSESPIPEIDSKSTKSKSSWVNIKPQTPRPKHIVERPVHAQMLSGHKTKHIYSSEAATKKHSWVPTDPANFLQVEQSNNPRLYRNLDMQPGHVPFSLLMTEAEAFREVLEEGDWKRGKLNGSTKDPAVRSLRSWRKDPKASV